MKKIFLYSGGLDSFLQSFLIKPDIRLYVDINGRYSSAEIKHLEERESKKLLTGILLIDKSLNLAQFEAEDYYLPFRNLYFAIQAMQYGQEIYMGFNEGDTAMDKTPAFFIQLTEFMQGLLKGAGDNWQDYVAPSWTDNTIKILAPYKDYTKAELLKMCFDKGLSKVAARSVRSCYHATSKIGCGRCSPCLQKFVAFYMNDIDLSSPTYFDNKITKGFLSLWYEDKILKYKNNTRTAKEFLQVIEKM